MRRVLIDDQLENTFAQQGYAVVPLLSAVEVETLTELFAKHREKFNEPFHTSHFSKDRDYKWDVNNTIVDVLQPKLKDILFDYLPIFGNFMVKLPDPEVLMPLHADWAYVNEATSRSVSVWVPLVDTDEHNGCLGVVPQSHTLVNAVRGPLIRQSSRDHELEWSNELGVLLPMKAGQAVIYDHGLLHYSPANASGVARPAINLSLVPNGEEIIHYCMPEGANQIEIYRVNDASFYINYEHFQRPETNTLIDTLPADVVKWMDDKMWAAIAAKKGPAPTANKKGLLARLLGI
jgi:hypothetical protein